MSCPHPVRAGSLTDRIRHLVWTQCGAGVGTGDGEAVRFLEGRWMSYLNSSPLWNQLGGTQGVSVQIRNWACLGKVPTSLHFVMLGWASKNSPVNNSIDSTMCSSGRNIPKPLLGQNKD